MTQKNFKLIFTLYFIVFGVIIALFSSFIGYNIQLVNIGDRIDKNAEEISYTRKNNLLKPDIKKMDDLLIALSNDTSLKNYLKNPNNETKAQSVNVFYAIAVSDHLIMQARYIDASGKEQIRVDRTNSSSLPFIVEESKLQDKSGRDYFQIASKMKPDSIWYSNIDLNIEHGKIEVPFRPTFRIATPIYQEGVFKGIVIINILMDEILAKLNKSTVFDHYIIDKEGNFISHPDEHFSWSKYTDSNANLIDLFPRDASAILTGKTKGENFYAYNLDDIFQNDDDVRLILKPKQEYIDALVQSNIQTSFMVIILSILLSIPLAIYASITPSKLQKALLESNTELKRFADIIDRYVATVTTKTNSIVTSVSTAFLKLSGYSNEELIGQKINIVKHPDTPKELHNDLWETIETGNQWHGELKNRHKDGSDYWIDQTIIPIKNENDIINSYMSVGTDITSKKELETLSMTDRLTGISNRRKLDELLALESEKSKRYDRPLSLLMIDIDYFKNVNDTYGHQIGDCTLLSVATVLKENIRSSDIVGRFGGEEFMVICPESDQLSACALGEKLRLAIEEYGFEIINHATISIGVAQMKSTDTLSEWVEKADVALYKAKDEGRNRVCF
jgi:diguanylate cyclase (GGDEF)-like protein/PAS domain S-box-containing protein